VTFARLWHENGGERSPTKLQSAREINMVSTNKQADMIVRSQSRGGGESPTVPAAPPVRAIGEGDYSWHYRLVRGTPPRHFPARTQQVRVPVRR
jgi:hypothetical protein